MQKRNEQLGFSSMIISNRKIKKQFFNQIDKIIDWHKIEKEINKYYKKGLSADGRPSYSGLLLFKMSLLQTWYGLSDYEVEAQVNDSLSFMEFTGLALEDSVPDHSVISRFRTKMTNDNAYEKLLNSINQQLEAHEILIKKGCIVDASVTQAPRKPKGKKEFEVVEDRLEASENESTDKVTKPRAVEKTKQGVDTQAAWIKKAGKLLYGYKRHTSVEDENGLVTSVVTTAANESDMNHIEDVVAKASFKKGTRIKADKGYQSEKNESELKQKGYRPQIMRKAARNRALNTIEKKFNKLISKTRYKVERTFGGMVRWFGAGKARYVGLAKMHTQHLIESIAYNLYRSPGIAMRTQIKKG